MEMEKKQKVVEMVHIGKHFNSNVILSKIIAFRKKVVSTATATYISTIMKIETIFNYLENFPIFLAI